MGTMRLTRRAALRAAAGTAAGALTAGSAPWLTLAAQAAVRRPDSLPDPRRPAGTPTAALPFDHIVVVMQENHSFDNYFGMLPRRGQPRADGFRFDTAGRPTNSNPLRGGIARVQHAPSACQPYGVTQAWTPTHQEVDGGRMDGFARVDEGQMLYFDQAEIPFYYSLANAFTVCDRWFSSAPCQTYPNRRFLLAGTAFGLISTDNSSVTQAAPNGTIVDRLNAHGITWKDYFVNVPATAVILPIVERNPQNMAPIADFFADCTSGNLPAVSFVDSEIGVLNVLGSELAGQVPIANGVGNYTAAQDQDEENPADIEIGESFVHSVVEAVISSPAWPRTLLVWTYDEHGGYYDHVPPPRAIAPDAIKPNLGPHDAPGGYDVYGPRVPAVVVSAHSIPHGVSSVVHDHTSVAATIEAKWNLPAMTYRDANAATLADCLQATPRLLEAPVLSAPGDLTASESHCVTGEPTLPIEPAPRQPPARLVLRVDGLIPGHHRPRGLAIELRTTRGTLAGVEVELLHGHRRLARLTAHRVGTRFHRFVLHPGVRLPRGRYTLRVTRGGRTLLRRTVPLGGSSGRQ
jgi:phospholipase C